MVRIMVTGVGGPAGASLATQLRLRGHWVLGVDMRDVNPRTADAVARVSSSDAPAYLWELRGLAAKHGIELVVPTVSDELVLMADARLDFAPGVEVLVADPAPVRIANDKFHTMRCLDTAGLGVPDFGLPGTFGSAEEAMDLLGGPVVVKPRVSRGGRNVQLLERLSDRGRNANRIWATLNDRWIVQRFAPGTEYAPVVHRSSHSQDIVVVLEKTALKDGNLGNAVSVRRSEPPADRDVAELALSTVEALGLTGPVDIDIRRMADGSPVVLEVNARFGANSVHAPELVDTVLGRLAPDAMVGRPG
ncbi:ATP-grasp domain-containing protein [Paenarthrobacter sp. NCHU4564]|uniref:ATP-grasp domain-containing protein n=1 Tax=Paenarthrobacter sp. NCHU4564 TaxID=3451353 RepID=UPI003F9CEF9E